MEKHRKHNESNLAELWEASANGDQQAAGELYQYYAPMLRAIGHKYIQDEDTVKDIVQDVFIKTFQQEHIQNGKAYLISAVKNHCLTHIKLHKRREEIIHQEVPTAQNISFNDQEIDSRLVVERIHLLSNQIQRKVMLMTINGYKETEIADEIDEPISRIRKIRYQARKHLMKDPFIQELK